MARKTLCLLILFLVLTASVFLAVSTYAATPSKVKYLVTFFEFEDLKHTKSIDELRKTAIDQVESYYLQVSYGKIKVTGAVISRWIVLPINVKDLKIFQWDFDSSDMRNVDITSRHALATEPGIAASSYDVKFVVYAGKVWGHSSYGMAFMNEFYWTGVYRHELGHVIGLPDLYSYRLATEGKPSGVWVGPWDLMSWNVGGLSSWSLLKLDWLDKSQVVRKDTKLEGTFTMDALGKQDGKTLLLQVHNPGTAQDYYVEVRERIGADAEIPSRYSDVKFGVLVYLVGAGPGPEEGLVRVIDSHPKSNDDPEDDLLDAPFNIGSNENAAFIEKSKDLSIIVLKKSAYTYTILLGTGSQGEQAREANDAIAEAQDAISKAESEGRTIGFDSAREQLDKAKAAYEESQFASATTSAQSALDLATAATAPATMTSLTSVTAQSQQTGTGTAGALLPAALEPYLTPLAVVVLLLVALTFVAWKRSKVSKSRHTA